ncbi:hypothetical protein WJX79_006548 [Trebouxia sp. C0005]
MWQASSLQATPCLAAALPKLHYRKCNQLQSKAVQSPTDSSQSVLQRQSNTMQAARKEHAAEFARYQCQPVCLPVYGLKGHHERASTSSLGSMYVLD